MITNNKDTQSQLNMKTCLKCEVYSIKKFIFAQFHRIFVIFSFTSFFLKIFLLCLFFILFNLLPADLLGLVVYWQIICRLSIILNMLIMCHLLVCPLADQYDVFVD